MRTKRQKPQGLAARFVDFAMNEGPVVFFILIMAFYFMFCGKGASPAAHQNTATTEIVSLTH